MLAFLRRAFAYDAWANTLVFSSLREQGDAGPEARGTFAHLLASQLIWLSRLGRELPPVDVWPEFTFEQCGRYLAALQAEWASLLDESTADDLLEPVAYTTTAGQACETTARDILLHVVTHSAYHRGQVASRVREVGLVPAETDYIVYARGHAHAYHGLFGSLCRRPRRRRRSGCAGFPHTLSGHLAR